MRERVRRRDGERERETEKKIKRVRGSGEKWEYYLFGNVLILEMHDVKEMSANNLIFAKWEKKESRRFGVVCG